MGRIDSNRGAQSVRVLAGAGWPHLRVRRIRSRRAEPAGAMALVAALILALLPAHAWGAAFGRVTGTVRDARGRPVAGAKVVLESQTHRILVRHTAASGAFDFADVAIGEYRLTLSHAGLAPSSRTVTVQAGYFPVANVVLLPRAQLAEIKVTANEELPPVASVTPITLVSSQSIMRTPGAMNVNSLAMITDYVPGAYEAHDMLHIRGGHQINWLIDGIEIPDTNIGESVGPEVDPEDIQTLAAERGSYNADEGDRTYGIFNVIPKTGFSADDEANVDLTAGNFGQTDDYVSAASHEGKFAYYASLEGNRSSLGLETPGPRVIHDATRGYGAFTNLQYEPGPGDSVRLVAQARQDLYRIPDCTAPLPDAPECLGQFGDAQAEGNDFALLSWAHTFRNDAVLTSSVMYHYERAAYDGGSRDYPTITTFHHSSQYEGAEENLRMHFSRNHLDVGVYGFAQQDQATFNLAYSGGSAPAVTELEHPTGELVDAWVQDTFNATRWLNLTAGVRATRFRGIITESATDPRLGATVTLPRLNWVLSAFWGKYYQAPPLETVSGPFVTRVTARGTSFAPLHGERDTERQFGVTIPVMGWRIGADYFVTQSRNFFDHNPIGESNIYLPLTDQGALIEGRELTVRSPAFWKYGQVHLAYSNQTADCFGSITGGLVVPGTACGDYSALDHDQRNTLNVGYNANLPDRFFIGTNVSVNSGLANGNAPPSHLPSYTEVDLDVGRDITRDLSVSVTGTNLFDQHLMTDNSLTFGGVHWNNPFQIYAEAHYRFHY